MLLVPYVMDQQIQTVLHVQQITTNKVNIFNYKLGTNK